MNTWDVVLLRFPFNDGGGGAKIRPALVISPPEYHRSGQDGLFVLLTSNVQREATYDVLVDDRHPEFAKTGLAKSSAIRVDKIMNLNKALISRPLGCLGPTLREAVKQKLRALLSL
jgi:mRNA-degrading endonuclease toxin of MazEF toxin-antitoxin module